jgi:hypothetical protein
LLHHGHSELLVECGMAEAVVDLLHKWSEDMARFGGPESHTSVDLSPGELSQDLSQTPGEVLYLLAAWFGAAPRHWGDLVTSGDLQLLCNIAMWRPLIADDLTQVGYCGPCSCPRG